jgi:hypothetical protein
MRIAVFDWKTKRELTPSPSGTAGELEAYFAEHAWDYNGERYDTWLDRLAAYHPDASATAAERAAWAEQQLLAARADMPDPRVTQQDDSGRRDDE